MTIRNGRNVLLQAAGVLALSGGTAFAGGVSVGIGSETGVSVGVGETSVSASAGTEAGVDASSGNDSAIGVSAGSDIGADIEAGDAVSVGVDTGAEAGVALETGHDGADDKDGAIGAATAADVAADSNAGLRAGLGDDTATIDAGGGAAAALGQWTLAEFSGKRVHDGAGVGIGTVESVVVNADSDVHLVVALDANDQDGHERVIPIDRFQVDTAADVLVLTQADAVAEASDLAVAGDAYALVDSETELQALLETN